MPAAPNSFQIAARLRTGLAEIEQIERQLKPAIERHGLQHPEFLFPQLDLEQQNDERSQVILRAARLQEMKANSIADALLFLLNETQASHRIRRHYMLRSGHLTKITLPGYKPVRHLEALANHAQNPQLKARLEQATKHLARGNEEAANTELRQIEAIVKGVEKNGLLPETHHRNLLDVMARAGRLMKTMPETEDATEHLRDAYKLLRAKQFHEASEAIQKALNRFNPVYPFDRGEDNPF